MPANVAIYWLSVYQRSISAHPEPSMMQRYRVSLSCVYTWLTNPSGYVCSIFTQTNPRTHNKIFQRVIMTFKTLQQTLQHSHTTVAMLLLLLRNNLFQKVFDCCRALNIHTAWVSGDSVLLSVSLRLVFSTFAAIWTRLQPTSCNLKPSCPSQRLSRPDGF